MEKAKKIVAKVEYKNMTNREIMGEKDYQRIKMLINAPKNCV